MPPPCAFVEAHRDFSRAPQSLGACRRRTPRTRVDLKVPEDAYHRDLSGATLRLELAPRRSPSACAEMWLRPALGPHLVDAGPRPRRAGRQVFVLAPHRRRRRHGYCAGMAVPGTQNDHHHDELSKTTRSSVPGTCLYARLHACLYAGTD